MNSRIPLYVACKEAIFDDEGVYCLKGKRYEVLSYDKAYECIEVEVEEQAKEVMSSLKLHINDPDVLITWGEE